MTIEQIFELITHQAERQMSELEMVMAVQSFAKIGFIRAANGYKIMRSKGMINNVIDRSTIGTLENLESNLTLMLIIERFDAIPINIQHLDIKPQRLKKPSEYDVNEIIPVIKMTRIEIANWINKPNINTDAQNHAYFKTLHHD